MVYAEIKNKVRSFYNDNKKKNINFNDVYEYVLKTDKVENARDLSFLITIAISDIESELKPSSCNYYI